MGRKSTRKETSCLPFGFFSALCLSQLLEEVEAQLSKIHIGREKQVMSQVFDYHEDADSSFSYAGPKRHSDALPSSTFGVMCLKIWDTFCRLMRNTFFPLRQKQSCGCLDNYRYPSIRLHGLFCQCTERRRRGIGGVTIRGQRIVCNGLGHLI